MGGTVRSTRKVTWRKSSLASWNGRHGPKFLVRDKGVFDVGSIIFTLLLPRVGGILATWVICGF